MDELAPIRKVITGITINTETAHCFSSVIRVVTELIDQQVKHHRIVQSLYQNQEGRYFLAFWNKLNWNDKKLDYEFMNDVVLIESEQAKQWMRANFPEKFESFVALMGKADKLASTQIVTLRMNTELRNHLALAEQFGGDSLNKVCINLIVAGLAMNHARAFIGKPPRWGGGLVMPDQQHQAVDEFEKALNFEDPDEQALAGYAESLYHFSRFDYPNFLPFVLKTLYRLLHINKNEMHALCFARWITEFYRVTQNDSVEYYKRNPPKSNNNLSNNLHG